MAPMFSKHPRQFTSWAFTQRIHQAGLLPSMGTIGDCYDNAIIESFRGRMQTELLNRQRRHSAIGMVTQSNTKNVTTNNPPHDKIK